MSTQPNAQTIQPNSGPIVLLVDDERRNLEVLETVLESPDYQLMRAQTSEEALLAVVQSEFACIVLDVRMPEMNGIDLARLIKTRKRTQHIPIIFLTAYFQEEKDILQGYGAGAVDYLTKPVNPEVLRSKVGVFVDLFRTSRALAAANAALQQEVHERRQLETLVLKISEREQQRIGQDLHDGLCQHLTGIKYKSSLLEQKLASRKLPEAEDARVIEELLTLAVEQARSQAHGLTPLGLEQEGLVAAFQELTAGVSSVFAIHCACSAPGPVSIPDSAIGIHLYRIAQEAISNAIKHGGANDVRVQLAQDAAEIRLTIRDNGKGLSRDGEARSGPGMGLAIMNYRARTIGAVLAVGPHPDGGTEVRCCLSRAHDNPAEASGTA